MTGRFRHCRTYALATVLVLNLFPAIAFAIESEATVTVTGRVCLPEFATATITSPTPGEIFAEPVITVSGMTNVVSVPIRVERNGTPAGTTLAEPDGTWSMPVTLTPGANSLVAISCQTSSPVQVTYQPPPPSPLPPEPPSAGPIVEPSPEDKPTAEPSATAGSDKSGGQPPGGPIASFFLTTTQGIITGLAGQDVSLNVIIQGGTAPYQATLAWGDGSTDQRSISNQSKQTFTHRFAAGDYKPLLQMIDADGRPASLAYVARISPTTSVPGVIKPPRNPEDLLTLLLIESALIVSVFAGWEVIHQRHLLVKAGCPGGKA